MVIPLKYNLRDNTTVAEILRKKKRREDRRFRYRTVMGRLVYLEKKFVLSSVGRQFGVIYII